MLAHRHTHVHKVNNLGNPLLPGNKGILQMGQVMMLLTPLEQYN